MTAPSLGILYAPLGRISLKNILVTILQNRRAESYTRSDDLGGIETDIFADEWRQ